MSKIEFKGFPMDVKFSVEEFDYVYQIQVSLFTKDRDNGEDIMLFLYYSYLKENYTKAEAIRTALIESMTHEIDECLYENNRRIFDPHDPKYAMSSYYKDIRDDLDRAANEGMIYNEHQ